MPGLKRYDPKNDKKPPSMRDFFIKHQDRILFGTDVVVTAGAGKSADALTDFWLAYRCSLELEEYEFRDKDRKLHRFKGLTLPEDVLRKVYRENWVRFLAQCGRYVPLDRATGAEHGVGRQPGLISRRDAEPAEKKEKNEEQRDLPLSLLAGSAPLREIQNHYRRRVFDTRPGIAGRRCPRIACGVPRGLGRTIAVAETVAATA